MFIEFIASLISGIRTHIKLPNKTGHVVVFVVVRQQLSSELRLISDIKTPSTLQLSRKRSLKRDEI